MKVLKLLCLILIACSCQIPDHGVIPATLVNSSTFEVQAINFLNQATNASVNWILTDNHEVLVNNQSYGGREIIKTISNRIPPLHQELDFTTASKIIAHSKVDFPSVGLYYLILNGKIGSNFPFNPQLNRILVPTGKENGIHFYHSVPEHLALDIYFNHKKVAEKFDYQMMDDLTYPDPIQQVTLVQHGVTPTFDALHDELHMNLDVPLSGTQLLIVYGYKTKYQEHGPQHETLYIYKKL